MASITITGLDAVKRAFRELEPKVARKVIKQAEKDALGIPKTQAQTIWPVKMGRSKRSIRIRVAKGPKGAPRGTISMALLVGGAGADKKGKARPWWSFLIEYGWTIGKRIRSAGKVVGRHKLTGGNKRIPGKHIMKKALRATEGRIKQIMTEKILQGIEREVKK